MTQSLYITIVSRLRGGISNVTENLHDIIKSWQHLRNEEATRAPRFLAVDKSQ